MISSASSVDERSRELFDLLSPLPATSAIAGCALKAWPEHAPYLLKSFSARSPAIDTIVEKAAGATALLMAGREDEVAADYRWTCDQLRDEELFFHREGRYRRSTFESAWADVYSNHSYMKRYVNGLLISQILWYNHAATFAMLVNNVLSARTTPFDYLEIGPGHGLMCYMAASLPNARSVEAWDVSAVSLEETRHALRTMGISRPISLREVDILAAKEPPATADIIVISEVLEHLERPDIALALLARSLAPGGMLFVNVPLNSPSPDHIYLLSHPDEVRKLVEGAGLVVQEMELFATQGQNIDKALRNKVSVSVGLVARLP